MSKYPVTYHSESRGELAIEEMANGHLHNAAKKLRARHETDLGNERGIGLNDHELTVLECLEREIKSREPAPAEGADNPAFGK